MFTSNTAMSESNVDAKAAADTGMKARGMAIADLFFGTLREQATTMLRYLKDVAELDQEGRKQFRVGLTGHLKAMRAHVKSREGKKDHDLYQKSLRSAQVRISEAITYSKGVDAGYRFKEGDGYHTNISASRMYLQSSASNSPTARAGRKAAAPADKVVAYVGKLALKAADLRKVIAALTEQLPKPKTAKQVADTREFMKDLPSHVGKAADAIIIPQGAVASPAALQ